jgi:hypothetical protein
MTDLQAAVPPEQIDRRLTPHLQPGERVLWQGHPELRGLLPLSTVVPMLFFVAIAIAVPTIIVVTGQDDVPFWFPLLTGGFAGGIAAIVVLVQKHTAESTVYALTERRTLHVAGARVVRSEGAERMEEIRVARRGSRHGDVYWRTERRTSGSGKGRSTRTVLIGFAGVPEPEAVASVVTAWKAGILAHSAERAARFADAVEDGRVEDLVRAGEAQRISAPEAGVRFFAPADWRRVDGGNVTDLRAAGGIVQMIQAVTRGGNTIRVMSPGGGAFEVVAGNGPPPQSFEQASAPRGGFQLISADPEVRIGPWTGFAVAHKVTGVNLFGFTMFAADVLQREVTLDLGGRHLLVRMSAPTGAHDLQRALDAISQTLAPG